jgi:hypothetical protein
MLLKYFIKQLGKRYGGFNNEAERKPEGSVHVSSKPQKDKVVDKSVGEYIDYEEVKDVD